MRSFKFKIFLLLLSITRVACISPIPCNLKCPKLQTPNLLCTDCVCDDAVNCKGLEKKNPITCACKCDLDELMSCWDEHKRVNYKECSCDCDVAKKQAECVAKGGGYTISENYCDCECKKGPCEKEGKEGIQSNSLKINLLSPIFDRFYRNSSAVPHQIISRQL